MSERRLSGPEAVALVRFAKGAFPAMQVDEFTPDAWTEILAPLRFEDCKEALIALARVERFVSASDIYGQVKRLRRDRVLAFGTLPPPPSEMWDDDYAQQRWMHEMNRKIADGELTRENYDEPALVARALGDLGSLTRRIPEEDA